MKGIKQQLFLSPLSPLPLPLKSDCSAKFYLIDGKSAVFTSNNCMSMWSHRAVSPLQPFDRPFAPTLSLHAPMRIKQYEPLLFVVDSIQQESIMVIFPFNHLFTWVREYSFRLQIIPPSSHLIFIKSVRKNTRLFFYWGWFYFPLQRWGGLRCQIGRGHRKMCLIFKYPWSNFRLCSWARN